MNILDRTRLGRLQNDLAPVENVVRLGRSIHYININQNILDRVRLVVFWNDHEPVVNVDRLGRSIHYININQNILDISTFFTNQKAPVLSQY